MILLLKYFVIYGRVKLLNNNVITVEILAQ